MRYPPQLTVLILTALVPGAATGQAGLSLERAAGLGLKSQASVAAVPADPAFGGAATHAWQALRASDYALYGGSEPRRLGLRAAESFGGIVYSSGGWGSSLEAGYLHETPLAPRRYSLTGQVHTSVSEGRTLSVGLKYRAPDMEAGSRYGMPGEMSANGYTLAGPRPYGVAYAPSYQLQMSYQYSAAGAFGLAWGREVETFTPFSELSGPRQFAFTGQHWLTPTWALSYDLLPPDLASPLRMPGLRLGVRYRF